MILIIVAQLDDSGQDLNCRSLSFSIKRTSVRLKACFSLSQTKIYTNFQQLHKKQSIGISTGGGKPEVVCY